MTIPRDALTNYRAALDHLAWVLVNQAGSPAKPKQVYFPIGDTAESFLREVPRKLPDVPPVILSMVQRFQPFQNGMQRVAHPLHLLEHLVNHDKHRSLNVLAMMSTSLKIDIPGEYENFELDHQEHVGKVHKLQPGTDLVRIYGRVIDPSQPHGVRVYVHGMRLTLTNEDGDPLEGILDRIHGLVGQILNEFEAVI